MTMKRIIHSAILVRQGNCAQIVGQRSSPAWLGHSRAFIGALLLLPFLWLCSLVPNAFLQPALAFAQGTIPDPATNIIQVAAGQSHTCALTSAGGVSCWGSNWTGQLGDGTQTKKPWPIPVQNLTQGVVAISTLNTHTCVLTQSGSVMCWGDNWAGQLGDSTAIKRLTPVMVRTSAGYITAISVGESHTCALTTTKRVLCWGRNDRGQLGNDTQGDRYLPVEVKELASDVQSIATGARHTCALTTSGSVFCWGFNEFGQLGNGANLSQRAPVAVQGLPSNVIAITAGGNHTCALTPDEGGFCWGANGFGQLGDGTTVDRNRPVSVQFASAGIQAISSGWRHTCLLTAAGAVLCWGHNLRGQIGDGTISDRLLPTPVVDLASGAQAISTGQQHTCAVIMGGRVRCWGDNFDGQLGDGTQGNHDLVTQVTALDGAVIAFSAAAKHTCAATTAGGAFCWGEGNLGNGTLLPAPMPMPVSGLGGDVTLIVSRAFHACVKMKTGQVYCWGDNGAGQLGDGTTVAALTPVLVRGLPTAVLDLQVGDSHTCALTVGNGPHCWGANSSGQLGNGTTVDSPTPVLVSGLPSLATGLSTGAAHTCALTQTGGVYCWGSNEHGQLGDGTTTQRNTPVAVVGLDRGVLAIIAGDWHTCVLTDSGGVKCWGANGAHQLGDGTAEDKLIPVAVFGLDSSITAMAASQSYTCVARKDNSIWCWGMIEYDPDSHVDAVDSATPTLVHFLPDAVKRLSAGRWHTCALTQPGALYCWGDSRAGQFGNGAAWSTKPVDVMAAAKRYLPLIWR